MVATLAVAAVMSTFSFAHAQCPTGDCGVVVQQASACSSCNGSGTAFGYPGGCGGCGGSGIGGGFGAMRADLRGQVDQMKYQSEKVRARNDAWPKPFQCADRQTYHNVWNGFYESGFVAQCTLIDDHFNNETGELNPYGQSVVRGLMKNSPNGKGDVFIYDGPSEVEFATKQRSVNDFVSTWYGEGKAQVAATNRWPLQGNGLRVETTNQLFSDSTPEPIIEVPTGGGSVAQAAQNGGG
jgi:hypothetical protein